MRSRSPWACAGSKDLTTADQACDYMLELPEEIAMLTHWQHVARLYIAAREQPSARVIAELTEKRELALILSFRLDLSADKCPRAPATRVSAERRVSNANCGRGCKSRRRRRPATD